jgi:hypothetical protein
VIKFLAATVLSLLLVPASFAGGKKAPALMVTFHLQSDATEGKKMVFAQMTAGKEVYYRNSPAFNTKDVVSFIPFPADDKVSYGVMLQLSTGAKQRLSSISSDNRGSYILAVVNGNVRDAVLIDRTVNDGMLVIWQRISAQEIRLADSVMPRIGQTAKEWKDVQKQNK